VVSLAVFCIAPRRGNDGNRGVDCCDDNCIHPHSFRPGDRRDIDDTGDRDRAWAARISAMDKSVSVIGAAPGARKTVNVPGTRSSTRIVVNAIFQVHQ